MYTKSKIQIINESLQVKDNFKRGLEELMEKYIIEDSVFVIQESVKEVTKGYFNINNEYSNLQEAIRNCNVTKQGIRIMENKSFQVGDIYNNLSECESEKILDIERLEYAC